jgi:hypothetical protein
MNWTLLWHLKKAMDQWEAYISHCHHVVEILANTVVGNQVQHFNAKNI